MKTKEDISLCINCYCMTKTIYGKLGIKKCGKCGKSKENKSEVKE